MDTNTSFDEKQPSAAAPQPETDPGQDLDVTQPSRPAESLAGPASEPGGPIEPVAAPAFEPIRPIEPVADLNPELDLTRPQAAGVPPTGGLPAIPPRRSWAWLLWLFGLLILLGVIAGLSGYGGYLSAIQQRTSFESTQVAGNLQTQFDLAQEDFNAGRYDLARQRLEYVVQQNPNFPGVTEKLTAVIMRQHATATYTPAPTPTVTPTPDARGQNELFTQAQAQLLAKDWNGAIETLLTLRKRDETFEAVHVDGMLFVALRNRGVDKISIQADLEGGTYDLALARKFGPLDVEARNWRDWAELYIRGASFWGVDWGQAVANFSQLVLIAPNLRDKSNMTSTERYLEALKSYGDWLALQGRWCDAQEQYRIAYEYNQNPDLEPTATFSQEQCAAGAELPPEGESTPDPSLITPTPEGGDGSSGEPTSTPTP